MCGFDIRKPRPIVPASFQVRVMACTAVDSWLDLPSIHRYKNLTRLSKFCSIELVGRGDATLNKRRNSIKEWYADCGLPQEMVYSSKKEDRSEDDVPRALFISLRVKTPHSQPHPTPELQEPDLTFLMKFLVLEGK